MKSRKCELNLPNETDPFLNMIVRPNRSPVLKPVVVTSRSQLQISRSAGSLREKFKLPPISSSSRKTQEFQMPPGYDRSSINTPNFKISTKKVEVKKIFGKQVPKPPFHETNRGKKVVNQTKRDFKGLLADVSFGDVDEKVGGLNEMMKKYKY